MKGLRNSIDGIDVPVTSIVVFHMKDHDMTVRLIHTISKEPVVEFSLGPELRTFQLAEFIHFWLAMVEMGCKADSESLYAPGPISRTVRTTSD